MSFAELLATTLREVGMTGAEAAREMGIPQQEVSRWLRNERVPSYDRTPLVRAFLGRHGTDVSVPQLTRLFDRHVDIAARVGELEDKVSRMEQLVEELSRQLAR